MDNERATDLQVHLVLGRHVEMMAQCVIGEADN